MLSTGDCDIYLLILFILFGDAAAAAFNQPNNIVSLFFFSSSAQMVYEKFEIRICLSLLFSWSFELSEEKNKRLNVYIMCSMTPKIVFFAK